MVCNISAVFKWYVMRKIADERAGGNMSEIARLRRQIALECEAMRLAMEGYATVASHEIIEQRYTSLGRVQADLAQHVGKEEASRIVMEVYTEVIG
jgi:hypothetical protein